MLEDFRIPHPHLPVHALHREHRRPHVPFTEVCTPTPYGHVFSRHNEETAHPEIPVVLVPGMIVSGNYMMPLGALLAPLVRVHVLDLPGYGKSEKPRHTLGIPELAESLSEWMKGIGLGRANFVANSFGCQVVAELAMRHSEKADRIVLQGPTVDAHARGFWRQLLRMRRNSRLESRSVGMISARDYKRAGASRVIQTIRLTLRDRIEEKLPKIQAPVLVVRGDRDPVVPKEWAEEVTRMIPNAKFCEIEGGAHTLNYSEPEKFADVIKGFLGL